MQKILMVVVAAALLYVLMQQGSSASVGSATSGGNCVDALHAEYRAQWAEMNQVQRAMVGMQAAGCAP